MKYNLGQDVIFSLPDVRAMWPLVRSELLCSAARGVADYTGRKAMSLKGIGRNMISRPEIQNKI